MSYRKRMFCFVKAEFRTCFNSCFSEFLDEIQSIRKVAKDINRKIAHPEVVVHCEDGASRSGVVILSEVLLASMEYNEVTF